MINLGQRESDNINPMITTSKFTPCIKCLTESDLGLGKSGSIDHINQVITLSVITLSGFQYSIYIFILKLNLI